jgi:sterol desaturase/sphingolipid hydroxylase (fatty acid hydroxylase superfamily)
VLRWDDLLDNISWSVARVATPQSDRYWLYFVSAATIAFIYYWSRGYGKEHVNIRGFLAFCFPRRIYTHWSAKLDFKYFVVNTVLYGFLIAPLVITSGVIGQATVLTLVKLFGIPASPLLPGGLWSDVAVTLASVLAADLAFFGSHYLQHRVGFLWEFHKVHHAAEVLHPLTLYRQHPMDTGLDLTLMGAATGTVSGISAYLFDASIEVVTILQTNALVFLFNVAGVHLRHSHVRLSYGPLLDRIFISPALHQIHHSCAPKHVDKNYGGILAIWDRLAGTLYVPREDEDLCLGLADGEHRNYGSIAGLYLLPFAKNAQRLRTYAGRLMTQARMLRRSR